MLVVGGWMGAGWPSTMMEWWWKSKVMGDAAPINHIWPLPAVGDMCL